MAADVWLVVLQSLKCLVATRDMRGVLIIHSDGSVTALLPKPLAAQVTCSLCYFFSTLLWLPLLMPTVFKFLYTASLKHVCILFNKIELFYPIRETERVCDQAGLNW